MSGFIVYELLIETPDGLRGYEFRTRLEAEKKREELRWALKLAPEEIAINRLERTPEAWRDQIDVRADLDDREAEYGDPRYGTVDTTPKQWEK